MAHKHFVEFWLSLLRLQRVRNGAVTVPTRSPSNRPLLGPTRRPNGDFCHANDPYEEHDFGSFAADGHMIYFKIDYFDRDLSMHSPDPADPSVTQRVITIMLAQEY